MLHLCKPVFNLDEIQPDFFLNTSFRSQLEAMNRWVDKDNGQTRGKTAPLKECIQLDMNFVSIDHCEPDVMTWSLCCQVKEQGGRTNPGPSCPVSC